MRSSPRPSETETFQHFTHKSDALIYQGRIPQETIQAPWPQNSFTHGVMEVWNSLEPVPVTSLLLQANRGDVPEWVPWHCILRTHFVNVWTWWHGCWWFLNKRGYPLRCFNNHVWYLVSKVSRFPMLLVGSWSFLVYSRWTRGWFAWLLSA